MLTYAFPEDSTMRAPPVQDQVLLTEMDHQKHTPTKKAQDNLGFAFKKG